MSAARAPADIAVGDERVIDVAVRAANDLGDHAAGTVVVTLPRA